MISVTYSPISPPAKRGEMPKAEGGTLNGDARKINSPPASVGRPSKP